MKISVIIPIFQVEAFIEQCARSLMEQTLEDVEYIFVDDCSPDGSINVLKHVVAEYHQRKVQILHHEKNYGLPAARNTGLAHATGEYIFHCDSDDYMESDALEKMFEVAQKEDADVVYSDWYLDSPSLTPPVGGRASGGRKIRYMRCPAYATPEEALRGLLHGTMKYNVWNKLIRRNLYNMVSPLRGGEGRGAFPEGHGMGEDMTMILLFAKARSVAYLPKATYHYVRQNEKAFTATPTEASYEDLKYNADSIISALQNQVPDEDLAGFKLNVKYPFLISDRHDDYDRWHTWFPEANSYITSHQVSERARLLEKCAKHRFFLILIIHYRLLKYLQ